MLRNHEIVLCRMQCPCTPAVARDKDLEIRVFDNQKPGRSGAIGRAKAESLVFVTFPVFALSSIGGQILHFEFELMQSPIREDRVAPRGPSVIMHGAFGMKHSSFQESLLSSASARPVQWLRTGMPVLERDKILTLCPQQRPYQSNGDICHKLSFTI